jgi:hypothetical protein
VLGTYWEKITEFKLSSVLVEIRSFEKSTRKKYYGCEMIS